MTAPIEVTVQNISTGVEVVRTYDSKNEALIKTNTLVVQMMSKFTTDEIFIRYRSVTDHVISDLTNDLLF